MIFVGGLFGWLAGLFSDSRAGLDYELTLLDLDDIVANPYQPRTFIDEDKLQELVNSIRRFGVITPIQVTPVEEDRYQLVAGERRVRAARQADLTEIPALVKNFDEAEILEVSFLENLQREPMGAVDKALMYERLRTEFRHLSVEELSEILGKSTEEITRWNWILDLPPATRGALGRGVITERTARKLRDLDKSRQLEVVSFVAHHDPEPADVDEKIEQLKQQDAGTMSLAGSEDGSPGQQSEIPPELQERI